MATFGERVVDVFYVTDLMGAQIASPTRQAAIKRALIALFADETKVRQSRGRLNKLSGRHGRACPDHDVEAGYLICHARPCAGHPRLDGIDTCSLTGP